MISALATIIRKEWLHILRDKSTFFVVLVAPVILSLSLSFILSTDVRTVKVVAVAPLHSEASRNLISRFENNPLFLFEGYVDDLPEAEKLMKTNEVNAAVILHPDYDALMERIKGGDACCPSPVQIVTDASNCAMGSAASLYIKNVISSELGESGEYFSDRMLYNPRLLSAYSFQPGIVAYIILLVTMILTSSSLVREKQFGTIDSVTLSPLNINVFYFGKSIPYSIIGLFVGCLTMAAGILITGMPVRGSIVAIFLITVLYIITNVLFAMYIALYTSNQMSAFAICWGGIVIPVLYCGGILVPVENLPEWGQTVSGFIYPRWYVEALRKLLIQGVDTIYVAKETLIMSISTIVVSLACHFKLKRMSR